MGLPDTGAMEGAASMYGGPMWQALARMGSNEFTPLIQQNFNPWASWSQMSPDQRLTAMGPSVLGPMQMNKDAGIYGSSWGQVENPRLADFFAGVTPDQLPATGFTPPTGRPPVDLQQLAMTEDPMLRQLQQYLQGMGGLNQNANPILQAIQQNLQGAPVSGVLPQLQGGAPQAPQAPGFTSNAPGGGGMDLMALLRQLGYLGPVEGGFAQGGRVPRAGSYQLHQGEVVLPKALFERMTQLGPQNEQAFQKWYSDVASRVGLAKNPDDPLHFYDYRGAWQEGAGEPGADAHFNSRYKVLGHPNQYVDDVDTRSGLPINTPKFSLGFPG